MLLGLFVLAMHTQCNTRQRQNHAAHLVSKFLFLSNGKLKKWEEGGGDGRGSDAGSDLEAVRA